jgi:AcrR family transcriptional regulator
MIATYVGAGAREEQRPAIRPLSNNSARVVRLLRPPGCTTLGVHGARDKDRRVQKTRRLLLGALGSLLHEKRYDAIVVREILDRANVGRSTFYAHFRDKDELLLSAIRDVLDASSARPSAALRRSERVVSFSRPMFEHVAKHRRASTDGMGIRSRAMIHERLRGVIAEQIREEVRRGLRGALGAPVPGRVPPELLVQHVTSSFVVVLDWWVETRSKLSPAEVDEVFRALVLPALASALD